MTTVAGVFKVTSLRPWVLANISSARGPRGQAFKLGQQIVGERLPRVGCPALERAVQCVRDVPNLDHS